jgi:hypothetical protein
VNASIALRIALTEVTLSPLAGLSYIESLSAERYSGRLLPRGLALHDILILCVDKVSTEFIHEPGLAKACAYLKLVTNGVGCREISKQLGLSREHISRVYREKATELVTEQLLLMVNNNRQLHLVTKLSKSTKAECRNQSQGVAPHSKYRPPDH